MVIFYFHIYCKLANQSWQCAQKKHDQHQHCCFNCDQNLVKYFRIKCFPCKFIYLFLLTAEETAHIKDETQSVVFDNTQPCLPA